MPRGEVNWQDRFSFWLTGRTKNGGKEHEGFCPWHEDPASSKTPSASFNFDKKTMKCFSACDEGFSLWATWEMLKDQNHPSAKVRSIGSAPSARSSGGQSAKLPTDEQIAKWAQRLQRNSQAMLALAEKRGLSEDTVKRYELGWDGDRYTIPIRDAEGHLLNVRKYKLGARSNKMLNVDGFGGAALYGVDALEEDEVVLTEGEMDKLVGREHGFNTVTTTAGAGTWMEEWTPLFKGKRVFIVYDVDPSGTNGAKKAASRLLKGGAEPYIVLLPLSTNGADLTNYFVDQGYGAKSFRKLLEETPAFEPKARNIGAGRDAPPQPVSLAESRRGDLIDKPLEFTANVIGKATAPYGLPARTVLTCEQDWDKAKCNKCPMDTMYGGQHELNVERSSRLILRLVDKEEEAVDKQILKELEIPRTCPRVKVEHLDKWTVEQVFFGPNVDESAAGDEIVELIGYNVGRHDTPINATVRVVGVSTPHPKDQRLTFQAWECEETQTSLDRFTMNPELLQGLSVFHPAEGQRPLDKLGDIARDLAANVTRIYGRRDMHIAYDLVWHSVLNFKFRGSPIGRGWLELLVMGDTRTGKSEAAERLRRHYGAGVLTSCEGATLAGLVGGAQQIGNRWVITWGTIPQQDRRLVVLDEASGLKDKNILENMSEVRSSGRAKIVKVVSQETNARTRLIWISNPVDGRRINEMPRGAIDAVEDLIKNPEDIARFDMAMVAAGDDVKSGIINAARPPKVPHVYTHDLCAALVLWAWSRTPEQVVWARGAERLCLMLAEKMGQTYVPDPPLVQAENARVKLARMAVAVAARLFSHDGTGERVLVTREHVRAGRALLTRLYRQPSFGYEDHSRKELRARAEAEQGQRDCWKWLKQHTEARSALLAVVNDKEFRVRDLEEFGGLSRDMSQIAIGDLMRMHMIRRQSKGYIRMEPSLVGLLRRLEG